MKRTLTAALCAAALLAGCGPQQPANQFTLKGTVDGLDGEEIYLYYALNDTLQITDTARVAKGAFAFSGQLDIPAVGAMLYTGQEKDLSKLKHVNFYMEPAAMTVSLDTAAFGKARFTGSFTQQQADSVQKQIDAIMEEAKGIEEAIQTETDHDKAYALREQLEPYYERAEKVRRSFVESHPASFLAPDYLRFLMSSMTYAEIRAVYDRFTPEVKQYSTSVPAIEQELEAQGRVQPGQPAPEFAALDVKGDSLRLSDFRGKYVILDFWASWCVPCRKSNPHMKALYKKYHGQGLEIICVADNDSNPDEWRKAIQEDGIGMFRHVLRGMKIVDRQRYIFDRTNDISDKYAIHFLPTKYLIDKEGKIVGKLTDNELDAALADIFGA